MFATLVGHPHFSWEPSSLTGGGPWPLLSTGLVVVTWSVGRVFLGLCLGLGREDTQNSGLVVGCSSGARGLSGGWGPLAQRGGVLWVGQHSPALWCWGPCGPSGPDLGCLAGGFPEPAIPGVWYGQNILSPGCM